MNKDRLKGRQASLTWKRTRIALASIGDLTGQTTRKEGAATGFTRDRNSLTQDFRRIGGDFSRAFDKVRNG